MVRIVSSRVHRCYSRSGAQTSARNERLNDLAHLIACTTSLFDRVISFTMFGRTVVVPASLTAVGFFLLLVVHAFDLLAACNAHNMFYRWSKAYKRKSGILSCPSKVDILVTTSYFLSSVLFYFFASREVLKGTFAERLPGNAQVVASCFSMLGAFSNTAFSLPSQEYDVSPSMSRAQNTVVSLFSAGSIIKLYSTIMQTAMGTAEPNVQETLRHAILFANILIWIGSALNFVRVSRFLAKVQLWITDELSKTGKSNQKGLLSWFKSSHSVTGPAYMDHDLYDISTENMEGHKNEK